MTAIGLVGSGRGFIVGADGRGTVGDKTQDDCQKIFPISDSEKTLVYAATGAVGDTHGFNLLHAIQTEVDGLAGRTFKDCDHYLRTLGGKVNEAINNATQAGTLEKLPEKDKLEQSTAWLIARIFVVGYFSGVPCLFQVDFHHFTGKPSQFSVVPYPPQYSLLSGSDLVRRAMYPDSGQPAKDSPFAQYIKPLGKNPALDAAEEYVVGYIEACSSALGQQMDIAKGKLTGGHIHVAEITPAGFKWRRAPAKSVPQE